MQEKFQTHKIGKKDQQELPQRRNTNSLTAQGKVFCINNHYGNAHQNNETSLYTFETGNHQKSNNKQY